MYSRDAGNELNHDRTLTGALRALPDVPPPDLWPTLARDLARRRSPIRRHARALALAAGALLAIGAATLYFASSTMRASQETTAQSPAQSTMNATSDASIELDRVRTQSQTIERWLAAVAARTPQSSGNSMAAIEVEDLIGLIDVQLSGARDAGEALPLWHQRVSLLEDLAAIRSQAFSLAETGAAADGSAAALHHTVN